MKMKKFLAATMVVALAVFASCSNENAGEKPNGGGEELNGSTYATFKFNLTSNNSRALADFDPTTVDINDVNDAKLGVTDLRLVIFDATSRACEHNEMVTGTTETVLVTAGKKKIFVFANTGKLQDATKTPTTSDFDTKIAAYTKGGTKSLTDFYAEVFSAGIPQNYVMGRGETTDPRATADRAFHYNALWTRVDPGVLGIPASNSNAIEYTLIANVTKEQAEAEAPSNTGTSDKNSFNIQLEYMSAKARLLLASDVVSKAATEDGTVIANVTYTVKNLAKYTKYVQNVESGVKKSYYWGFFNPANKDDQSVFDPHIDYASRATATVKTLPLNVPDDYEFIFVPENNDANILRGQSSYYAMKATYEPGVVICDVTYNPLATPSLVPTEKKLADCGVYNKEGAKDYIYVHTDIKDGNTILVGAGTYFKNYDLLLEYIWTKKYDNGAWDGKEGTTTQRDEAKAFMPTSATPLVDKNQPFYSFIDATSWYRIDLGKGKNKDTDYGVLRGNAYTGVIDAINGPGLPSEKDLTENPGNPVKENTYVSVTILAAKWNPVDWSGSVE